MPKPASRAGRFRSLFAGEQPYVLVLSGGGGRGAYQAGVWEALEGAGLRRGLTAVAGASIGAINGALLIQGGSEALSMFWRRTEAGELFAALNEEGVTWPSKTYWSLSRDLLRYGRIRTDGLQDWLRTHIDEAVIRRSGIDFGLAVWDLTGWRLNQFRLCEIPSGQLADYLLASARFPLFGPYRLGEKRFLDGGLGANLPLGIFANLFPDAPFIAVDVASVVRFHPRQLYLEYRLRRRMIKVRASRRLPFPANFSRTSVDYQLWMGREDATAIINQMLCSL